MKWYEVTYHRSSQNIVFTGCFRSLYPGGAKQQCRGEMRAGDEIIAVRELVPKIEEKETNMWTLRVLEMEAARLAVTRHQLGCGHYVYVQPLSDPALRVTATGLAVLVLSAYCPCCSEPVVIERVLR